MSTEPPILLDTDFASSFAWVDRMDILESRYSGRMVILEEVMVELDRAPFVADRVRPSVDRGHISVETMLAGSPEALQFARLRESGRYGAGEASCMAYLLHHVGILASNNLADVKRFCIVQQIPLLTTADVLLQAHGEGRVSVGEADAIWGRMLACRRRLPAASFSEFLAARRRRGVSQE